MKWGWGASETCSRTRCFPALRPIQTRLRYVLFLPWLYQRLEARRVRSSDIERAARHAEVDLIGPLEQSDDPAGIIGLRARHTLVRLPSSVYWSALTRWGHLSAPA